MVEVSQLDFMSQEEVVEEHSLPRSRRDPVQRDNPIDLGDCHVVRCGVKRHFAPLAMTFKRLHYLVFDAFLMFIKRRIRGL